MDAMVFTNSCSLWDGFLLMLLSFKDWHDYHFASRRIWTFVGQRDKHILDPPNQESRFLEHRRLCLSYGTSRKKPRGTKKIAKADKQATAVKRGP